jgi:very-short-patch-repair endonuclease
MGGQTVQFTSGSLWNLARTQHGVVTRRQLLELGYSRHAIDHRIDTGRLHPVWRAVYAIGRPDLTTYGRWMAAVLTCGADATLSHESAGAIWGIRSTRRRAIEVSVPASAFPRRSGILVHRRADRAALDVVLERGIPVTSPVCTLIDLATRLPRSELEAAVNEADKRGLSDPERLRSAIAGMKSRRGAPALRRMLDHRTFALTDSELERRFLPLARGAGLPQPQTGRRVNGFKVDFYWPDLGLVVETDGLRYHRTPAQQARDRVRDHAHAAAGLTPLRFTHAQVAHEAEHVQATLTAVVNRLRSTRARRAREG